MTHGRNAMGKALMPTKSENNKPCESWKGLSGKYQPSVPIGMSLQYVLYATSLTVP